MTSVAPLSASYARRTPVGFAYAPAPSRGSTTAAQGPADPIGLTVELYLGSLGWTDVSAYVYYRDRVRISRGRPNESSRVQPQTCSMTLNNGDGRFSPRNPVGAWYGLIGRNTPIRVSRMQNGVRRYRFVGEVPAWPVTWDVSGRDVYVPIQAAGMLRRLQQGTQTLGSAMYRAYALHEAGSLNPVAYWPCEDGATAVNFTSGLTGNPAMTFNGSPTLASNSSFTCSKPLPVTNGSQWYGTVPTSGTWTDNVCRFLMQAPSGGETDGTVIASMYTLGTVKRADLIYRTAGGLQLKGYDSLGVTLFDTGSVAFAVNGALLRVSMALRTSGANVTYEIQTLAPGGGPVVGFTGTLTTATISAATGVTVNPAGALTGTAIGHVSVQAVWDTLFDLVSQLNAWNGETPGSRYGRLMGEQGINVGNFFPDASLIGGNAVTMGYQLDDTLMNLVQQIADTDGCLIYEARDQAAVVRRSRIFLYNQGTAYQPSLTGLTLDYAQHEFSGPLNPVDDDANTRNDITAERISGSFSQATDSNPLDRLSTVNVGDYATTYSLSIGSDAQLPDAAHWRLHLGTTDEPRYPAIPLNLRHPSFTSNLDLLNAALTVDIGDLVAINNPPAGRGAPDQIRLILQGYSETLGIYEHDMVLNCSPEAPYRVGMYDDLVLGRYDTDGSSLAQTYPLGTETTLLVASTNTLLPAWTTSAGAFPFDIAVGGERMTVANITGGASPQSFTVTRSVNGVVKTQTQGTDVRLWQPTIVSL